MIISLLALAALIATGCQVMYNFSKAAYSLPLHDHNNRQTQKIPQHETTTTAAMGNLLVLTHDIDLPEFIGSEKSFI